MDVVATTFEAVASVSMAAENNMSSFGNNSFEFDEEELDASTGMCSKLADVNFTLNETNCTSNPLFTGEAGRMNFIISLISQIVMCTVFIVGLCGNTLVIYVVLNFSKMQTVTNLYILNLAIADELFVFGMPFLIVTAQLHRWTFGSFMCKFYFIVTSLNQFTSSMFLTVLSADRYIAVCHPITSTKLRTAFISRLVSLSAWAVSALMIVPVLMYANVLKVHGVLNCNIIWPENFEMTFTLYSFILSFAIPVIFFVIFYSLVIHKLSTVGPNRKNKEKRKTHRKVTKMVLTVIAVYVFCYTPYWVLQVSLIFSSPGQHQSSFKKYCFLISSALTYMNSAINPILYAFLSDNFKKSFMKACVCANSNDVNSILHIETSLFPRRTRGGSSRPSRSFRDRESSITTSMVANNVPLVLHQKDDNLAIEEEEEDLPMSQETETAEAKDTVNGKPSAFPDSQV